MEDIRMNKSFKSVKKHHDRWYLKYSQVERTYWSYVDIFNMLEKFDTELFEQYLRINFRYPSLLANIGRLAILFIYGGIYHDLKFLPKSSLFELIEEKKQDYCVIAEEHPKQSHRVRMGNIVALRRGDIFFKQVLQEIKPKLINAFNKKLVGGREMFKLGSGTYIKCFNQQEQQRVDLLKVKMEPTYVNFNMKIYRKNIVHWQKVHEPIIKY